jgi:transcriptional regulator with GAF, ATPase, and Fis domain
MSSHFQWETNGNSTPYQAPPRLSGLARHNLDTSNEPETERKLGLQEEVQRYEIELIRAALQRTRGNQRKAAKLLDVKVTTLNCKIKRYGIEVSAADEHA